MAEAGQAGVGTHSVPQAAPWQLQGLCRFAWAEAGLGRTETPSCLHIQTGLALQGPGLQAGGDLSLLPWAGGSWVLRYVASGALSALGCQTHGQ